MSRSTPTGDSALAATGFALRVLREPQFLWAPVLLAVVALLPVLVLPGPGIAPPSPMFTGAEMADYIRRVLPLLLPALAVSVVTGLIVTPVAIAVGYRLANAYVSNEQPAPFAPGIVPVSVGLFLQSLILFVGAMLTFGVTAFLLLALAPAIGGVVVVLVVLLIVAVVWIATRLAFSQLLVVQGEGPVQALRSSWRFTAERATRVFRWLFVSGLAIAIISAIITAVVDAIFGGIGTPVDDVLRAIVAAPFGVVTAIVITVLWRNINRADAFSGYPNPASRDAAARGLHP